MASATTDAQDKELYGIFQTFSDEPYNTVERVKALFDAKESRDSNDTRSQWIHDYKLEKNRLNLRTVPRDNNEALEQKLSMRDNPLTSPSFITAADWIERCKTIRNWIITFNTPPRKMSNIATEFHKKFGAADLQDFQFDWTRYYKIDKEAGLNVNEQYKARYGHDAPGFNAGSHYNLPSLKAKYAIPEGNSQYDYTAKSSALNDAVRDVNADRTFLIGNNLLFKAETFWRDGQMRKWVAKKSEWPEGVLKPVIFDAMPDNPDFEKILAIMKNYSIQYQGLNARTLELALQKHECSPARWLNLFSFIRRSLDLNPATAAEASKQENFLLLHTRHIADALKTPDTRDLATIKISVRRLKDELMRTNRYSIASNEWEQAALMKLCIDTIGTVTSVDPMKESTRLNFIIQVIRGYGIPMPTGSRLTSEDLSAALKEHHCTSVEWMRKYRLDMANSFESEPRSDADALERYAFLRSEMTAIVAEMQMQEFMEEKRYDWELFIPKYTDWLALPRPVDLRDMVAFLKNAKNIILDSGHYRRTSESWRGNAILELFRETIGTPGDESEQLQPSIIIPNPAAAAISVRDIGSEYDANIDDLHGGDKAVPMDASALPTYTNAGAWGPNDLNNDPMNQSSNSLNDSVDPSKAAAVDADIVHVRTLFWPLVSTSPGTTIELVPADNSDPKVFEFPGYKGNKTLVIIPYMTNRSLMVNLHDITLCGRASSDAYIDSYETVQGIRTEELDTRRIDTPQIHTLAKARFFCDTAEVALKNAIASIPILSRASSGAPFSIPAATTLDVVKFMIESLERYVIDCSYLSNAIERRLSKYTTRAHKDAFNKQLDVLKRIYGGSLFEYNMRSAKKHKKDVKELCLIRLKAAWDCILDAQTKKATQFTLNMGSAVEAGIVFTDLEQSELIKKGKLLIARAPLETSNISVLGMIHAQKIEVTVKGWLEYNSSKLVAARKAEQDAQKSRLADVEKKIIGYQDKRSRSFQLDLKQFMSPESFDGVDKSTINQVKQIIQKYITAKEMWLAGNKEFIDVVVETWNKSIPGLPGNTPGPGRSYSVEKEDKTPDVQMDVVPDSVSGKTGQSSINYDAASSMNVASGLEFGDKNDPLDSVFGDNDQRFITEMAEEMASITTAITQLYVNDSAIADATAGTPAWLADSNAHNQAIHRVIRRLSEHMQKITDQNTRIETTLRIKELEEMDRLNTNRIYSQRELAVQAPPPAVLLVAPEIPAALLPDYVPVPVTDDILEITEIQKYFSVILDPIIKEVEKRSSSKKKQANTKKAKKGKNAGSDEEQDDEGNSDDNKIVAEDKAVANADDPQAKTSKRSPLGPGRGVMNSAKGPTIARYYAGIGEKDGYYVGQPPAGGSDKNTDTYIIGGVYETPDYIYTGQYIYPEFSQLPLGKGMDWCLGTGRDIATENVMRARPLPVLTPIEKVMHSRIVAIISSPNKVLAFSIVLRHLFNTNAIKRTCSPTKDDLLKIANHCQMTEVSNKGEITRKYPIMTSNNVEAEIDPWCGDAAAFLHHRFDEVVPPDRSDINHQNYRNLQVVKDIGNMSVEVLQQFLLVRLQMEQIAEYNHVMKRPNPFGPAKLQKPVLTTHNYQRQLDNVATTPMTRVVQIQDNLVPAPVFIAGTPTAPPIQYTPEAARVSMVATPIALPIQDTLKATPAVNLAHGPITYDAAEALGVPDLYNSVENPLEPVQNTLMEKQLPLPTVVPAAPVVPVKTSAVLEAERNIRNAITAYMNGASFEAGVTTRRNMLAALADTLGRGVYEYRNYIKERIAIWEKDNANVVEIRPVTNTPQQTLMDLGQNTVDRKRPPPVVDLTGDGDVRPNAKKTALMGTSSRDPYQRTQNPLSGPVSNPKTPETKPIEISSSDNDDDDKELPPSGLVERR